MTKWFDDAVNTFSSTRKKVKIAINGKEIQSSAQSDIFGKIALIKQTRKIEMQKVFCFTFGHVPRSLVTDIGAFVKTNQNTLMHKFQTFTLAYLMLSLLFENLKKCL